MGNKLYVNATILHEKPSGLGVYAENIIKCLRDAKVEMKVFAPINIEGVDVIKTTKYVKPSYKKKGGLMRFIYTQFVLPFKVHGDAIIYHPFQYLSLLSRKKQVITIHDFIPLYYKEVAKHQYKYYKYIMPLLLKKAYKIICISQNTKDDLMKFYNVPEHKVHVIYNGYNKEIYNTENVENAEEMLKENYNIDYPYIVMVGAEYTHKNIRRAMEAFSKVQHRKNTKLVLIGKDSEYIRGLKEYAKELNIEEEVKFVGYVPTEHLKALYYRADAFLYPTLYEGFGLPVLEAWGCDTLVLCSNNSSVKEIAGEGAITFNPESTEEISNAIKKVIDARNSEDKELIEEIERIKLVAKENLKNYNWEKTSKEILKVIQ